MASEGPRTILFEIFWANQKRAELIETALEGKELPPEDYPVCVMIGAEGTWTPTGLAGRLEMPLPTVPLPRAAPRTARPRRTDRQSE